MNSEHKTSTPSAPSYLCRAAPFECVVLAGGLGTRLRQIIPDMPKPLAPVAGKPFLDILLSSLACKGCAGFVLSVGYLGKMIMNRYGKYFEGVPVRYALEEEPLGTGGGLRLALNACDTMMPIVVNGDTFTDVDISAFQAYYALTSQPALVGVWLDDASRYGHLQVADGKIVGFVEKGQPGPALISAGCYCLPRSALEAFPEGHAFSLEQDYFAHIAARSHLGLFVADGLFIDIGVPEDYARAQIIFANMKS